MAQGNGPKNAISPKPFGVPQVWWEWWASLYDTDVWVLEPQAYGPQSGPLVCTATAGNSTTIQVPEDIWVFSVESRGFVTATGNAWTIPYRIGFKVANANDWFNGQWMCPMVTGDVGSAGFLPRVWSWPKYLAQNEIVTVTVDNNVNGASSGVTVDVLIKGFVPRKLKEPIQRVA